MSDKIKQEILSCLQQDFSDAGLSIEAIASKIGSRDIRLIKITAKKLFEEGTLIESGHNNKHKRYKLQKLGQDLLGQ